MISFPKRLYPLIFFLSSSFLSYGQISIAEFLGSANTEQELNIYQSQISYLSKDPYRMPVIRELEFRTQTNEIGANEQRYGLRLSPANPWEVRNTKRVFQTYQSLLNLKQELAFKEILETRYLMIIDLLYLKGMQELKAELADNLDAQISIMEKQSASDFFDAEDYVKLKLEQMEEQAEFESYDFSLSQRINEMKKLYEKKSEPANLSFESIISFNKLKRTVDSLMTGPLYTTSLAYGKEKLRLAEQEYALEKSDINPGFIQAAYRPYKYSENKNPIGINLGITIPVFNPNKGRMVEEKLEILEAENELALEKRKAEEELNRLLSSLSNALKRYENLEAQINSYDLNKMMSAVNALNNENPAIRLKFNVQLLKIRRIQLQVKRDIYQTYIHILSTADLLNQRPLVNFLSTELENL